MGGFQVGPSSEENSVTPVILAHRGASRLAPPNTLSSFKKAVEFGADGVELDVRLTKDNKLVVIHDPVVDHVSDGKGLVSNYTLGEIKELDFGYRFSEEFKGEKIPTLEEALDILKCLDLINIEIKNDPFPYRDIEKITLETIYNMGIKDKVIISSFDHELLVRIRGLDKDIKTGVLYSFRSVYPNLLAIDARAGNLHPFWAVIDEDTVREAHRIGLNIFPWTVDDKDIMERLMKWEVDGIITNDVQLGLRVRSEVFSS